MRKLARLALVLIWFAEAASASEPAATSEEVLLDRPGGRPVAILLSGAPRKLGEEKEGFVRVTLEGWVRTTGAPGTAAPLPAPMPQPVDAPRLVGTIRTGFGSGMLQGPASAHVFLLGPSSELDPLYASLRQRYEADRAQLEAAIEKINREREVALNSQDNFREASRQKDRTAAALAARQKDRRSLGEKYGTQLEDLFARFRVAEGTADAAGMFAFPDAPVGNYRLLAVARRGEEVRRWYVPVAIPRDGGARIDLGPEGGGDDPYFERP